ncbi:MULTISPECIES: helix-turn-helix domain-containing protein [Streptomyces]|uniref:Helix-turn-helix domain-containing protein n=1 Tax=Streptomyces fimbriatus TaxID=68197 RepID=A0ABW0DJH1_STRFI
MNPPVGRGSAPAPGRDHRGLVDHLLALKERSGCSFAQLASNSRTMDGTTVSATTLKRVVDLKTVPTERAVVAFVRACGVGGEQEALRRWRAARAEERGILPTLRAPAVDSIRTHADLNAALAAAYERAGAPALRVLQERAATPGMAGQVLLPLKAAWRATRREGRFTAWYQCEAFLRGCGIPARDMPRWKEAWQRTAVGRPAARDRFQTRPAPEGLLSRRGRTPSAVITWTPEMEKSVMVLGTALASVHDTRPQMERSAVAAVKALEVLLRSFDPPVQRAALTQGLLHAVEAVARLNGTGPLSSRNERLDFKRVQSGPDRARLGRRAG